MADYDLRCLVCGHGPHANGPCTACLHLKPCTTFIRADFHIAQAVTSLNNLMVEALPIMMQNLTVIRLLLAAAFPEADAVVKDLLKETQSEVQEERKSEQPEPEPFPANA